MIARGRHRHKPGEMNRAEAAYEQQLKADGVWYRFECIKLKLADRTFLTPDFCVMSHDGLIEMHEVKGFMEDDAAVKLKVAAALYPFRFILVRKVRNGWERTEI